MTDDLALTVLPDAGAVARAAADVVEDLVRGRPAAVLGLAAGRTPRGLYAELARRRAAGLDLAAVTTFHLDEYLGLGADDPRSFARAARVEVHEPFRLAPDRGHVLDGRAPDPAAECARYEAALAAAGGLDVQVLGLGGNGHIAFNEPGSAPDSRTRVVPLAEATRRANDLLGPDDPTHGLTMGVATILEARRLLLLVTGEGKAAILRALVEAPVDAALPASFLRTHPALTVLVDEAAARELPAARR